MLKLISVGANETDFGISPHVSKDVSGFELGKIDCSHEHHVDKHMGDDRGFEPASPIEKARSNSEDRICRNYVDR